MKTAPIVIALLVVAASVAYGVPIDNEDRLRPQEMQQQHGQQQRNPNLPQSPQQQLQQQQQRTRDLPKQQPVNVPRQQEGMMSGIVGKEQHLQQNPQQQRGQQSQPKVDERLQLGRQQQQQPQQLGKEKQQEREVPIRVLPGPMQQQTQQGREISVRSRRDSPYDAPYNPVAGDMYGAEDGYKLKGPYFTYPAYPGGYTYQPGVRYLYGPRISYGPAYYRWEYDD